MKKLEYNTVSDIQIGDTVLAEFYEGELNPIRRSMYERSGGSKFKYNAILSDNGYGNLEGTVIDGFTEMLNGRMFHYLVEFPTGERLWYDAPYLRKVEK